MNDIIKQMLSIEETQPGEFVATILSDDPRNDDIEIAFEHGNPCIAIAQGHDDHDDDVVTITPNQAYCLHLLLANIIEHSDEEEVKH